MNRREFKFSGLATIIGFFTFNHNLFSMQVKKKSQQININVKSITAFTDSQGFHVIALTVGNKKMDYFDILFENAIGDVKDFGHDLYNTLKPTIEPQLDEMEKSWTGLLDKHIISPAKNSSIIGIFQDSMLGCFQFTRENIQFTQPQAMNLLMEFIQ